jgi:hypothetical protein
MLEKEIMIPKRSIARIDLGKKRFESEEIPEELRFRFLGGRGLGAYLLFKSLPKGCDPLKPSNCIVISTGLLGGMGAALFECAAIAGKSQITRTISFLSVPGWFSAEMRWTGFDHLVLSGQSKQPVYLFIHDGMVEFRNAGHLKEKEPEAFLDIIQDELKEDRIRALIVSSGIEHRSRIPILTTDYGYSFPNTGIEAVLYRKNVKAVVCHGSRDLEIKHPIQILSCYQTLFEQFSKCSIPSNMDFAEGKKADKKKEIIDYYFPGKDRMMTGKPAFSSIMRSCSGTEKQIHTQSGFAMTFDEINRFIADSLGFHTDDQWNDTLKTSFVTVCQKLIQLTSGYELSEADLQDIAFRCRAVEELLHLREAQIEVNRFKKKFSAFLKSPTRTEWNRRSMLKLTTFKGMKIEELWPLMK